MKDSPQGWPRITSVVCYEDPVKAIDWLCRAFGFEVRMKIEGEGGRIVHSELEFGDGLIIVAGAGGVYATQSPWCTRYASPASVGGKTTQSLCIYVDDVDAHHNRAKAAGATVFYEPKNSDYGDDYWEDRTYGVLDLEGHVWGFIERIRNPKPHGS